MNTRKPAHRTLPTEPQGSAPAAKLGSATKAMIGRQLRLMYSEVVNQGVPERFVEILRGLDDTPGDSSKREGPNHDPSP
jgi:hypothetical protein